MANLKNVLDELTTKGIDTDLLKETIKKNRKKIEKISDESDLQVTLYRLFAPIFGAGEARAIAQKILPFMPEFFIEETRPKEAQVVEKKETLFYALKRKSETIYEHLPRSFHQSVFRLASQPAITYLELNEYFFNISDRSLEALVRESSMEQLFQWTTKRLLSWPKLYGEDEHDIYLFYFADFEERHVMHSDDVVFFTTEVWDNIGISVEWPINHKQLRGLNATSTILTMINDVFKYLAGIFEWKRLFSKIDKDAIIEADVSELRDFFVKLLHGELNYFLNPRDDESSFCIKLESVHDFKYELGFRPEHFIKTRNPELQSFGVKLMNLMFHWKLFRWMGFRDEPHVRHSKESFFDLFMLACRKFLNFTDVNIPTQLPSLDEILQRCQEMDSESGLDDFLVEPIASELAYLVKIVTLKGGINQDLMMGFRNGYLSSRIGKALHRIHALYREWLGEEKGTQHFLLYIYRVASEGLVSSDNMVIKKSLQYLIDMDEESFGRSKNRSIKSEMVQTLLKSHQVINVGRLEDSESAQQWIKNTILQVYSFVHGARLFKILREGFKRFEERPLREIWGADERKEIFTEIQFIFSRSLENEAAQKNIENLVRTALQEGFQKISLSDEIIRKIMSELPWHENLTNQERLLNFITELTNVLHREINPLLGRSSELQEERVSFADELEQAVSTENLIRRMYREHRHQFSDIARNNSQWLYHLDEEFQKSIEPLLMGGIIYLSLQKRPLKGNVQRIQTFEDLFTLLENELASLMTTSTFQLKEKTEQLEHIKDYIINTVELWSNAFRITDLINSLVQSQDFVQSFDVNIDQKDKILHKPEIRSFIAQTYLRNWLSAWFNYGIDFAESIVNPTEMTEEEEDKIWEIVDAVKRVHFPQFLRWFLIGNTNYRLGFIDSLIEKYLQLTDTVIQAEFASLYPEIGMALLVMTEEGAKNLSQIQMLVQYPETECDIHYLKRGEIHSVIADLTTAETAFPKDMLKNVAALSILHGLELEAITFKFPFTSIYLTMSYHPRVSILTDVVGTTSIIVTKTLPRSEQVADIAPINAEVISGTHSLFAVNNLANPIMKLVLLQRLRYTALTSLKPLDFVKKLKIPSDLNLYEEMSQERTTLGRNYEIWGLFRTRIGKKIDIASDERAIYVKQVQFFGKSLSHFAYINQFFIAFTPLVRTITHSLENSKTFGSTMYLVRNKPSFLSPVTAVFRLKDGDEIKKKIIVLYDNPRENIVNLCILWENDQVKEPYSVNKARFVLESNRDKDGNEWKLQELASRTFNLPVSTPFFDVAKRDNISGEELPDTDLEKIESISLGGF